MGTTIHIYKEKQVREKTGSTTKHVYKEKQGKKKKRKRIHDKASRTLQLILPDIAQSQTCKNKEHRSTITVGRPTGL